MEDYEIVAWVREEADAFELLGIGAFDQPRRGGREEGHLHTTRQARLRREAGGAGSPSGGGPGVHPVNG